MRVLCCLHTHHYPPPDWRKKICSRKINFIANEKWKVATAVRHLSFVVQETIKYLIQKNAKYKYYIKLHTKTVKKWRDGLIYPLYNKLNYFLNDKVPSSTIELYGSENMTLNRQFELNYMPILNIIGRNYKKYESKFLKYCSETTNFDYACEPSPSFVGGTIFVFNDKYFDILKQIKNMIYWQMLSGYMKIMDGKWWILHSQCQIASGLELRLLLQMQQPRQKKQKKLLMYLLKSKLK